MGHPLVGCRIDLQLFKIFKRKCKKEGKEYGDIIRPAIKNFIYGKTPENIRIKYIEELEAENNQLKGKLELLMNIKETMNVNEPKNFVRLQKLVKYLWSRFYKDLPPDQFTDEDKGFYANFAWFRITSI